MLRKIRITLAAVFFVCITWLFLDFTGTAYGWLAWMTKLQFLEALLALNVAVIIGLVVVTLVFGRIYCSIICPLGILQDIFGWMGKKAKKNRYSFSKAISWLRYTMLGIMVVAIAAGVGTLFQLLAPYSAFGRIATILLQSLWKMGNNVLATLAEQADSYAFYQVETGLPNSSIVMCIALATLVILVVLAWRNGRTYCNTICPVGTLLSFCSRFSFLKIHFDEGKCRNCSMCSKNCKAACIDYKTHQVDYSRCVVCGNCIESCKFGALSYSISSRKTGGTSQTSPTSSPGIDESKRSFLVTTALMTTAAMAQQKDKVMDGGLAEIQDKVAPKRQTPLAPPGARSLANLEQHCTGCQLCVSECPNQVLRPSGDLMHLMMPNRPRRLDMLYGLRKTA